MGDRSSCLSYDGRAELHVPLSARNVFKNAIHAVGAFKALFPLNCYHVAPGCDRSASCRPYQSFPMEALATASAEK